MDFLKIIIILNYKQTILHTFIKQTFEISKASWKHRGKQVKKSKNCQENIWNWEINKMWFYLAIDQSYISIGQSLAAWDMDETAGVWAMDQTTATWAMPHTTAL